MQGINSLLSNLASVLQNMEIQDPGLSRQFNLGQRLEAMVLSREGNDYLLQSGARLFHAQSDLKLPVGEKLFLYVSEQKDGRTFLKLEFPATATSRQVVSQKLSLPKAASLTDLKPGQVIPARIESVGKGLMLVRTEHTLLTVRTTTDLPVGTDIKMQVIAKPGDTGEFELQISLAKPELSNSKSTEQALPQSAILREQDQQIALKEGKLLPGETFTAVVKSKSGNYYLVEAGSDSFFLEADTDLQPEERLQLLVKEEARDKVMLERTMPNSVEQEKVLERVRLLAAKYGFTGEKEITQLAEQLAKLPVDEKTGIRYLLDPHLATAVVIPGQILAKHQAKIEIEQYKQATGGQRIWEVSLDVNLAQLGQVELVLKLIDGRIYAWMWAEQPETEALLKAKQNELDLQAFLVEIVPVTAGPLIPRETEDIIDMRV